MNPRSLRTLPKRVLNWLRELFARRQIPSPGSQPSPPSRLDQEQGGGQDQPRYSITQAPPQDGSPGEQVGTSESLRDAHQIWTEQTGQQGRIVDNETGEDVTPPTDDNGRYVVLTKDNNNVGSYDDLDKAIKAWTDFTGQEGKIVDVQTNTDVTPRKDYLNAEQIRALQQIIGHGRGGSDCNELEIDRQLIEQLVAQIVKLRLPVFDVTNIDGTGAHTPKQTVPIKRREVTIKTRRVKVPVQMAGPPRESVRRRVRFRTDDTEQVTITRAGEIPRARPSDLAGPRELLAHRYVTRGLRRRAFFREVPGEPTVRRKMVWKEEEYPDVRNWTEEVEISEEPRSQLLALVVDISGSMWGIRVNLAMATGATVMGAHLDDGSRYTFLPFADEPAEKAEKASTPAEKRKLIVTITSPQSYNLGSGTNTLAALEKAAESIRRLRHDDDRPEILYIGDGDDNITATDIYRVLGGNDITLHSILVNPYTTNWSFKQHSTTYCELAYDPDTGKVTLSDGSSGSQYDRYNDY